MASNVAYLTIDGIPGDSTNSEDPNSFGVLSYSFGAANTLHFVKELDSASAAFRAACNSGRHLNTAVISGGISEDAEYLRITMTEVMVTAVQWSGNASSNIKPLESVSLAFGKSESVQGFIPPPHETVQPDHQHLISYQKFLAQRRLRKPGR